MTEIAVEPTEVVELRYQEGLLDHVLRCPGEGVLHKDAGCIARLDSERGHQGEGQYEDRSSHDHPPAGVARSWEKNYKSRRQFSFNSILME